MRVRLATPDDLDACIDILEETAAEGLWLGTQYPFDRKERHERMLAAIEDDRCAHLVVVRDGISDELVVGHLGLEVAPYGVAQFGMCVAQAWRGQGAGSALVKEAIATAGRLGAHKVAIQVWPHNQAALGLYAKFGFEVEGRLRRHYPRRNGELWDALVLGLVLDDQRPGSSIPETGVAADG